MTLDLAKLRAETLALIDGTTPGPWWTDGKYNGRDMGCAIIAARTDAGPLPGNPTRGMVAFSSAITNTQARGCEANARLIAAAPALAADTLRLLDEIERLTAENETAVRRGAEWMRNRIAELARQTAANIIAESAGGPRHRRGYEAGRAAAFEIMARTILAVPLPANGAALAEGGPDDR